MFTFFSDANNLEKITPPWLHFKVLSQSTPNIQEGTTFNYKLKVRGIPLKWKSLITDWQNQDQFADIQLKGPYFIWHHYHRFIPYKKGTIIEDEVYFSPPRIPLLRPLISLFIKRDVKQIFSYRQRAIEEIF